MTVTLHGMVCGSLHMPLRYIIDNAPGDVDIPVPTYLISHPKGTVVFDTGMERSLRTDDPAPAPGADGLKGMLNQGAVKPVYKVGQDLASRLESHEVDPTRVDYLVNSHFHFDHCGGNEMLPNARWLVQRREWEAHCSPECRAEYHFQPHEYDLGHDRIEIDGEHDIFGDGSVVCVPTFGHTPGHQSLRVKLEDGEVVITADACYFRRSLEQMALPYGVAKPDAEKMLEVFRTLQRLEAAGAQLLFGHDDRQWAALTDGPARKLTAQAIAATAAIGRA